MSKGIAIRTILLLLIGAIVAGVIIYLVYSSTTAPTLSATECQARLISWCTSCKNSATATGWSNSITMGSLGTQCAAPMSNVGITGVAVGTTCFAARNGVCAALGIG